jgi:hypothetical protein
LEYLSAATQIGLTATPKETKYVSNIHYFGAPADEAIYMSIPDNQSLMLPLLKTAADGKEHTKRGSEQAWHAFRENSQL